MKKTIGRIGLVSCLACAAFAQGNSNGNGNGNAYGNDNPKAAHETLPHNNAGGGNAANQSMLYHGGPVMLGTVGIYYIWYGNWGGNTATTILTDLANSIGAPDGKGGGSPYFNINQTYYNGANQHVSGSAALLGSTTVGYTHGTSLSDANIQSIVSDAIAGHALPANPNAVYFVLTSADVTASSGFCTQYCGWHTRGTIAGSDIKYAFIGNPDRCPASCEEQSVSSPNGNPGADGMASIIAHELEEATTDPDLNAWYDRRGYENADKCAWTFGTTFNVNGAKANVTLGSRNYLIQQNWVNSGAGFCAMHQ